MNNPSILAKARSGLILLVSLLAVSTAWALDPVEYLDENGQVQTITEYTEIVASSSGSTAGVEFSASSGWYVVKGEVSYKNNFAFQARPDTYIKGDNGIVIYPVMENTDVRLILTDGAKLTVVNDASERETSFNNLTIYAQSTGENMGAFEITSIGNAIDVKDSLIINGGAITANGTGYHNGIHSEKYVVINGGSIKATGFNQGIWGYYLVEINGGVIDASAHEAIRSMVFLVVNDGTIEAHASGDYAYTTGAGLTSDSLKINGGTVNASGARGIAAKRKVTIAGGIVNASSYSTEPCTDDNKVFGIGSYWSDVILSGGTVTASAEGDNGGISGEFYASTSEFSNTTYGSVGISLAGATVRASSYRGPVVIDNGLTYYDSEGNSFTGTLSAEQQHDVAGKTIAPMKRIVFDDGLDAFEIAWNPGEVPCNPSRYGKKFLGWYADKSFEVPFDFTNFNDEAIAYGLWEDLTEVTYLDENGKEQRVVPDYELVGNECTDGEVFMNGGWILVKGEVSYKNNFAFLARSPYNPKDPYTPIIKVGTGDVDLKNPSKGGKDDVLYPIYLGDLNVNLILADGAKLTVENDASERETSFNNLTIYAQSTGENMGAFEITSIGNAIDVKDSLIINGGAITANGTGYHNGIHSEKYVVINGGSIKATGFNQGIWGYYLVEINGGVIDASAHEAIRSMVFLVVNDGTIEAHASGDYAYTTGAGLTSDSLKINGGTINASGARGIAAKRKVTIAGGIVNASSYSTEPCTDDNKVFGIGSYWSDVILSGGTVTASAEGDNGGISGEFYASTSEFSNTTYGSVGISLAGATVRASSYRGPVVIDDGLAYSDGEENFFTGTLSAEQQHDVAGKTIAPMKRIVFDDGLDAFEIAWNPGEVPCNPSRYGKKFLGWYADKSFEVPFDFTNFNDEAIAYGLWEDLTEVTYLDENGKEQRVVPDYELVGNECTDGEVFMNGGWILVKGEVSYKNNFAFLARSPYNPKDPYTPIIKVGTGDVDLKNPSKGGKDDVLYPIYLGDLNVNLILADGAKLTVENDVTEFQTSFNNLAIYAQSTGANQGVFEISSYADAIYAKDALIINGGSIKATSRGSGISSENDLVINNGSITASGNNHGIWGSRLVKINDGVINASGYEAVRSMDSIVVNGGTVEARAIGNRVETGAGFATNGYVDINGGSVTAAGGFAIGATKEVTIAGGDVKATSSNYGEYSGYVCFGIGSFWRDVNLKGGTVTVSAENGCNGIYANNSENKAINLSGVTVNASSYVGPVVIDDGLTYYDSEGNSFTGTLSAEQQLDIANKYVYPYQPALVIAKDENDNAIATLDGNFEKDLPVIIEQETMVDEVVFNRTFTSGRYATLMFPFDVYADNLIGAKLIDEFGRIDTVKDETTGKIKRLEAHTKAFWDKPAEPSAYVCDNLVEGCEYSKLLKANTPYMVQLDETHTSIEVRGAVKLVTNAPKFAVRYGDWEFVGVYQYKKWTEDDEELLNGRAVYGFVGKAVDGFTIGKFVRIKAGAYINPMRAYMRYNPLPGPQMALRYSVADWNKTVSSIELPESITILRDVDGENHEERTTVIGHFNTHTGDFRLQRSTGRVFDLKGRAYGKDARKARGAYYGKKVVK